MFTVPNKIIPSEVPVVVASAAANTGTFFGKTRPVVGMRTVRQ